ncbi:MAG: thymidine phosphorylase [bacterium]
MTFSMLDFIEEKKLGKEHSSESISAFVKSIIAHNIPDYQISAWLMAVRLNGMTEKETACLTISMAENGQIFDLRDFPGSADKHSTGGVGDKTTLIVAPLVASCGVPVVKFSGRALDFTGGTLDKFDSIPGFNSSLSSKDVLNQVRDIGLVLAGASEKMVPADSILYALRDVTSTVDSIPLIAASVMSKKIASGAENIVLDVKFGDGAFMRDYHDALSLAKAMVSIGLSLGRKVCAILSSMNEPLGRNVGNALEVIEAIETLKGDGPDDLTGLSIELAARMISLSKNDNDTERIRAELLEKIRDGSALDKFRSMVKAQGGDERIIDDYGLLPHARFRVSIIADKPGYIGRIATREIGNVVRTIGGGRYKKDDKIDAAVGLKFFRKTSDKVEKGERVVDAFYNDKDQKDMILERLKFAIEISEKPVEKQPLIREII